MRLAVDGSNGSDGGVAHGALLSDFATAAVTGDDSALERTRREILNKLGQEELVDAAALVAHYEKMDRIADATGLPLDAPMQILGGELRDSLDIGKFTSAQNTKVAGPVLSALQRTLRAIMLPVLKHLATRNK
ncbi:MAG: hypothetical protein OXS28_06970 [Gammaproteobacteria bacterium]|nr:hypothetical protein [Gammaproteobacteria bacterium]MDE0285738.1 hypothetical protein [Gammaproteobacteria bacterium]